MWSYYGSKTNLVDYYPSPKHDRIIEPFAGSARYSLKHFEKDVLLVDKYPVIIDIWNYLQSCSPSDITGLPHPKYGENISSFNLTEVEKNFLGFVIGCGANLPRKKVGYRKTIDRPHHTTYTLKRIADQLYKIKHWTFRCWDYSTIKNVPSTWFVDPPYQKGGEAYKFSNKKINFLEVNKWVHELKGQVIVCENMKANWMNFKPLVKQRGSLYSSVEAIWTNEPTVYDNEQLKIQY